jgi:hypothetical protein
MPALLFLTALFAGFQVWSPTDIPHHLMALGILAIVLVYAWIIAMFTEFRTTGVRRWVENLLGAGRSHQKPPSSIAVQSRG